MTQDVIGNWVEKARSAAATTASTDDSSVQVIKRIVPQNKGSLIMEVAEKIRPFLINMFDGVRDENGMLLQPARVRGIALNVAQSIVNQGEYQN